MPKLEDSVRRFGEQFVWQPVVEYNEVLRAHKNFIVCGMGGSHIGAWLLKRYGGLTNIVIHRDYGLPDVPDDFLDDALVILVSFSGGTEEVLDAARSALERGLPLAAIAQGGKLLGLAREHAIPHIQIPDTGLEPRMAIAYSMIAIARLLGNQSVEDGVRAAGTAVDSMAGQADGMRLAEALRARIPVVYASALNIPLAYLWKIKLNETAKIPAFANTFPEMNHNELEAYDTIEATYPISERVHAVFLTDESDHSRVIERMRVATELLTERGTPVTTVPLIGEGFEKAFGAALLADWVSIELARMYGVANPEVPLVAEFRKRINHS